MIRFDTNQTEAKCIIAVSGNWTNLQYVKVQTEPICLAAVKAYGDALQYVQVWTLNICEAAVQNNTDAFRFVSGAIIHEMRKVQSPCLLSAGYIKHCITTEDEKLSVISLHSECIIHCTEQKATFYDKALLANPKCIIQLQNMTTLSEPQYHRAISMDHTVFEHVKVQPLVVYMNVFEKIGWTAFERQCKNKNNNMYYVGLKKYPELWTQIKDRDQIDTVNVGFVINPDIIKYVNPKSLTYAHCLRAVQINWWNIRYVPAEYQTYQLCCLAIDQKGGSLEYIIEQTPALLEYAEQKYGNVDKYIRSVRAAERNAANLKADELKASELKAAELEEATVKQTFELGKQIDFIVKAQNSIEDKVKLIKKILELKCANYNTWKDVVDGTMTANIPIETKYELIRQYALQMFVTVSQ